jgi:hypothetical protein
MRKFVTAGLLLSLVACSDEMKESYASLADAERAGAVERGWVPAFVPASARGIRDVHNLDTNAQTLEFTARPSDVQAMVTGLRSVSAEDKSAAAELSKDLGLADPSEAYVVCSEPLNGALVVNRESGRAVYRTPVEWADDDCSQAV